MEHKYYSRFTHGDLVCIELRECGRLENGRVTEVKFTEDKVWYDVCFTIEQCHGDTRSTASLVLRDIDSAVVKPAKKLEQTSSQSEG